MANPVGAIKDFDVVVYLAPNMAQAWLGRSVAKLQIGDSAGALADADEALRRCPEEQSAPAYHARGGARCKLRDFRGAVQDYNKAIQLNPEFVEAYISRGNARYHLRDRSCFFDYRMSFRIDPQRAAEELSRIIVDDARRNADEVLENCEKHLRINPRDFTAHVRKALTVSLLGRAEEAQEHLNRAYEILPDATTPLFLVIQAIQQRGNR
jgi:tetratricopeptide (TPR) repeat protein